MSRTTESGAYLGGIGTMLTQSEVCPACGRVHTGRRFGFLGSTKGECPLVIVGSLPTVAHAAAAEPDLPAPFPEPARVRVPIEAVSAPPLPTPPAARKPSGMNVPWPMPSHLEDYL